MSGGRAGPAGGAPGRRGRAGGGGGGPAPECGEREGPAGLRGLRGRGSGRGESADRPGRPGRAGLLGPALNVGSQFLGDRGLADASSSPFFSFHFSRSFLFLPVFPSLHEEMSLRTLPLVFYLPFFKEKGKWGTGRNPASQGFRAFCC